MMHRSVAIACLLIFCFGCNTDKKTGIQVYYTHNHPVVPITYDTGAIQRRVSDIIDSVEFIPLETNAKSLVGDIQYYEIFKNYIVVLDDLGLGLTVFLLDGSFHAKIEPPGKEEKGKFKQFAIDRNKEEIVVYDSYLSKFLYYNFDGKFIMMKEIPFTFTGFTILAGNFVYFSGYTPFYFPNTVEPIKVANDSLATLVYSDAGFKHIYNKESLYNLHAVDNANTFSNERDFFTVNMQECLFSYSYSNRIFHLDTGGIKRIFEIQIPQALQYPVDYLDNPRFKKHRISNSGAKETQQLIWSITDAFLIDSSRLIVNIKDGRSPVNYYLFDWQRNSAASLSNNLLHDATSGFFLLTEHKYFAAEPGCAYGFLSAGYLIETFKNSEMLPLIKSGPLFKRLTGHLNNLSNGVITKIHFKKIIG